MIFDRSKKGQGLSLNVIIIAALALIVLVVLIMVFTGRIAVFEKGLSQEGKAELIKMRITYGDCHPTPVREATFDVNYGSAESVGDKASEAAVFREDIARCKAFTDKANCDSQECTWS